MSTVTNADLMILSDVDPEDSSNPKDPKVVVAEAEARARVNQNRNGSRTRRGTDRQYAEALHREADALHHKGDYESALVLYHRAAKICPRDSSHGVAARRTIAAINSATNPSRSLTEFLPQVKNDAQLAAILCPESAALRASNILKNGPADPASAVSQMLRYFDRRRIDFWRTPSVTKDSATMTTKKLTRSRIVRRQLISLTNASLKNMEASFAKGDLTTTLKTGEEILHMVSALRDSCQYKVLAYRLIALTYVSIGRHDRAVNNVARMIHFAVKSKNDVLRAKSLVTLGKVHLTFGHLDAVARAWERLAGDLEAPVPRAWVQHEIGRCHLESGKYSKALFTANRCLEAAKLADSKKWLLHGKLLAGQVLIKLGRLDEALEELRVSAKVSEEEGDTPTLSYLKELISKVSEAAKNIGTDLENRHVSPRIHQGLLSTKVDDVDEVDEEGSFRMVRRISTEARSNLSSSDDLESFTESGNEGDDVSTNDEAISSRKSRPSGKKKSRTRFPNSSGTSSSFEKLTFRVHPSSSGLKSFNKEDVDQPDTSRTRVLRTTTKISGKDPKEDIEDASYRSAEEFSWMAHVKPKCNPQGPMKIKEAVENVSHSGISARQRPFASNTTSIESSIPTGRTYDVGSPHVLHRHSLPSTPRKQNLTEDNSCAYEGFTAIFEPP